MKIEGYMVNFEGVGKLTIWAISKVEEEDIVYCIYYKKGGILMSSDISCGDFNTVSRGGKCQMLIPGPFPILFPSL